MAAWGSELGPELPELPVLRSDARPTLEEKDVWHPQPVLPEGLALPVAAARAVAAGSRGRKSEEWRRYVRGLEYLLDADVPEAEASFKSVLEGKPDGPVARDAAYWQGFIRLGQGRWNDARKSFHAAALPGDGGRFGPSALYALAWMARREKNFAEVKARLERLLEKGDEGELAGPARFGLGEARFELGEYDEAAMDFQRLTERHPETAGRETAALWLAEARYQLKDYSLAGMLYRDSLKADLDDEAAAQALYGQAASAYHTGDFAASAELFRRLADRFPGNALAPPSLYNAWAAAAEAGEESKTQEALRRLGQLEPGGRLLAAAMLERGLFYFRRGRLGEAAEALGERARREPEKGPSTSLAGYVLGRARSGLGDWAGAAAAFEKAWSSAADEDMAQRALLAAGWSRHRAGDQEGAVKALRRFIVDFPGSPYRREAVWWLAESYRKSGNFSQALFLYRDIAAAGTRAEEALFGIGEASFQLKRWSEAGDAFASFLQKHPSSPLAGDALYLCAESRMVEGRWDEARSGYEEYLRRHPAAPEREKILYRLGIIRVKKDDLAGIIETFANLERSYPGSAYLPEAWYFQSVARFRQGTYDKAAEGFARAAKAAGDTDLGRRAGLHLGNALFQAGRFREAADAYGILTAEKGPGGGLAAEASYGLARSLMKIEGEGERAMAVVEDFLRTFPDNPLAPKLLFEAAEFESRAGRTAAAAGRYRRISELYPVNELADDAALRLAQGMLGEGNAQEAAGLLEKALADYPEGSVLDGIWFTLGMARRKLGDCRGAEDAFAAVLTRFPQSRAYPDSLYQSALCLVEAGDGTRAGVRLDELMKQYPDYPGMPEACLTAAAIKEAGRDYRQALNLLRKVVSSGREELSGRAQLGIARLYRLMGESDRAVIEYLKIPYLYPGRTALEMEARLEAAATYAQVGSVEEALKVLRIVVDNPEAGDYRARAEELIGHLGGDPGRPAGRPPEKPSP